MCGFVAGGGGAIGRPLVRQLVERGYEAIATTRTPEKLDRLRMLGGQAVVVPAGLARVAAGEVVVARAPRPARGRACARELGERRR